MEPEIETMTEIKTEVQSSAPLQAEVPVPPAQHRPEALPTEPKKTSFWGKLNPFRGKTFKKKKDDSALRSPGDAATESRQ